MKNLLKLSAFFLFVITIHSCSVSKEARTMKQEINGTWLLETINTEGISGKVTATLFNEASFNCFVGSSWNFVANTSTGTYNINGSGTECASTQRLIKWSIYEPTGEAKQFQFKRMADNKKSMDDDAGFRFEIASLTNTNMQLKSHITFEGRPAVYVLNFVKK